MLRLLSIIGLIIILSACGSTETNEQPASEPANGQASEKYEKPEKPPEGNEIVAGALELNIVSFTNEKAEIELKNQTENAQVLEFTSGQQYDMWIKDESGKQVFHWAEGKMFTQAMKTETLQPGESKVFSVAMPKLEPGTYTIRFKVTSHPSFEKTFKQTIE